MLSRLKVQCEGFKKNHNIQESLVKRGEEISQPLLFLFHFYHFEFYG